MHKAFCKVCQGAIVGKRKDAIYCGPKCIAHALYERQRDKGNRKYGGSAKARLGRYKSGFLGATNHMYHRTKNRASKSGLDFKVSLEYVRRLAVTECCAVTGIPFIYDEPNGTMRPFGPSIDRIDNSKGYVEDNIRVVCVMVNLAINQFGEEAFLRMCRATATRLETGPILP